MTIHVSGLTPASRGRQAMITPSQRDLSSSRRKVFFEDVINMLSPAPDADSPGDGPDHESVRKPRIVYIRDYPTLAQSQRIWFPSLLNAIRNRRQGPMNRSSGPVAYPMIIVYGITAPLFVSSSGSAASKVYFDLTNEWT